MTTVPALTDEAALNQYVATGGQTDFNFSFMIFATADIEVYVNGVLKTEVTDYTVKKSGGGSISSSDLPLDGGKVVFGSGLTADDEVTLNRNIAIARSTGYSVAGAFRADVVNREFTKQLAITQQLRRDIERSIRLATFDSEGGDLTLPTGRASKLIGFDADGNITCPLEWANIQDDLSALVAIADDITTVAGIHANVTTVAGISSAVSTVSGISANVTTVAGISANVTTVAGIASAVSTVSGISSAVSNVSSISSAVSTVSGISANVSTVAGISANVTTVAGIATAVSNVSSISAAVSAVNSNSSNINTVAGISSAVSTVAGISGNVTTVAGISANVTTVAGISANVTTVAGIASAVSSCATNMTSIQNAASFGFPTIASGDEYKMLQVKADRSGYNAVEAVSRKNAIINGAFNIWQRGTTFSSIASATYFADRFFYQKSGAMVHDVSRSTDVPTVAQAGRLFNYSALVDCTTIDNSIASGDHCFIAQRIEGFNWLPLAQKAITLSFWVKATKTGTYCVALRNNLAGTPDRSYVGEYTVSASDTWEFKTVTFSASPSAGTWDYTTGTGIELAFVLTCGSTYQTTAGAWQTGNYIATSNQVNACDNTSNNFRIAGVQLEVGSLPTPFENRSYSQELANCERYFQKYGHAVPAGAGASGTAIITYILFRQTFRSTPTATLNVSAATFSQPGIGSSTSSGSTINSSAGDAYAGSYGITGFSGLSGQNMGYLTTSDVFFLSAEL